MNNVCPAGGEHEPVVDFWGDPVIPIYVVAHDLRICENCGCLYAY